MSTTPVSVGIDAGCSMVSRLRQSDLFTGYQSAFEIITGLPLVLREAGSFRTPLQGSPRVNPFCVLMTQTNRTCAACLQLQQRLEEDATLEAKTLQCYAGLSESAVPVRVGDKVLGYLQTGQVFLRTPSTKRFNETVRTARGGGTRADRRKLKSAYFQTRVLTSRQYRAAIRLLATFADHLSAISNRMLLIEGNAEAPVVTNARRFIAAHQSERLCLGDLARVANMSPTHFSRFFHQATGLTFTEYIARARVEAAKQMLLNVHTRISEAAFAVGFQSISQFNRGFLRFAGETPSRYRGRLHGWSGKSNRNGPFVRAA